MKLVKEDSMLINLPSNCKMQQKQRQCSSMETESNESSLEHHVLLEANVRSVLSTLSEDEIESAARASYQYIKKPVANTREYYASKIVTRYLESKNGNVDEATRKVKKTLKFRQEFGIEDLMTAFDGPDNNDNAVNLVKGLSEKKFIVQGYDRQGRSTLCFFPTRVASFDPVWHVKDGIYSLERAIACSKSIDGTINAIIDMSGFCLRKHSPPLDIAKKFVTMVRNFYAGQIHRIYVLDPPFTFSILWKIFSPLIGTKTRSKIHFLSGNLKVSMEDIYALDQLPSPSVSGGGKCRDLDIDEYLYETPFDSSFDE